MGRRWLNSRAADDFRAEEGTSREYLRERKLDVSSKTRGNVIDDVCEHVRSSIVCQTQVTTYVEGTSISMAGSGTLRE